MTIWPSVRWNTAGWPVVTESISCRVGSVFDAHSVWSQPPPTIHTPGGCAAVKILMRSSMSARDGLWSRSTESFCRPAEAMWVWASLKPGMTKAPARSTTCVLGPRSLSTSSSVPTATMVALVTARAVTRAGVGDGSCCRASGSRWAPVRILPCTYRVLGEVSCAAAEASRSERRRRAGFTI